LGSGRPGNVSEWGGEQGGREGGHWGERGDERHHLEGAGYECASLLAWGKGKEEGAERRDGGGGGKVGGRWSWRDACAVPSTIWHRERARDASRTVMDLEAAQNVVSIS